MMNRIIISVMAASMVLLLSGCKKEPPKCSDEKTLTLVRQIIVQNLGGMSKLDDNDIKDNFKIEFPNATAYDEKISRYSCAAKLTISTSDSGYQVPVNYYSQLDDSKQHLVLVQGFMPGDLNQMRLKFLFMQGELERKKMKSSSAPSSIQPASQSATIQTAQKSESPQSPTSVQQSKSNDVLKNYKVSFDCNKASNYVENTVCTNPRLGALDGLLLATYKSRLDPQFGADKNLMKKDQTAWIKKQRACTSENCIEQVYKERIKELCEMPVVSGAHPGGDCNSLFE